MAPELRVRKDHKGRKGRPANKESRAFKACRAFRGCKGCRASRAFKGSKGYRDRRVKASNPTSCASPRSSWEHNQPILIEQLRNIFGHPQFDAAFGVVIAFTGEVLLDGIDAVHVFQVDVPSILNQEEERERFGLACRCPIVGEVFPVEANISGNFITDATIIPGVDRAKAIAFVFDERFLQALFEFQVADMWVKLRGDFVLDTNDPARAIDAEFVRHEFDTGDHPATSKLGIQGGLFESWFMPVRDRGGHRAAAPATWATTAKKAAPAKKATAARRKKATS